MTSLMFALKKFSYILETCFFSLTYPTWNERGEGGLPDTMPTHAIFRGHLIYQAPRTSTLVSLGELHPMAFVILSYHINM